ncbi:MAG: prepilin-type N-terminal cleavage/methylation domain-containing protein [Vulcanimicrobiota bacterium]
MKKQGFTLIELMIVIAIISILASIIIPNITKARAQAQFSACLQNMKAIQTTLVMFDADGVVTPGDGSYEGFNDDLSETLLYPDYISNIPTCPSGGNEYYVKYLARAGNSPRLSMCVRECSGSHREVLTAMYQANGNSGDCGCCAFGLRFSQCNGRTYNYTCPRGAFYK